MTPVDIHFFLMSLEAIKCLSAQEKSNAQPDEKASNKGKKGRKRHVTESMVRVPKTACTKKHCSLCKKHGGMYITHNTKDCHRYKKGRMKKADFCAAKKGRKKPNPAKQSFVQ